MDVLRLPGPCPPVSGGRVVTIGVFDGVHLGHQRLIAGVRADAARLGAQAVAVTFDPHPASVVRPGSAPLLLTDLGQKLELLAASGLDATAVVTFDERRAAESAADFVAGTLVGCLDARLVVVGHDFHFGHDRQGTVPFLERVGREAGFGVVGSPLYPVAGPDAAGDGELPVSSSRIRRLVAEGDVSGAAALLGRPLQVRGRVDHGDARGRELGYPTANVAVPAAVALPADGVYAGFYRRPDGSVVPAALSLGRRPTFYEEANESLLEAHLLDFRGDLYGEEARVDFVARLRGQERFDSAGALIEQMARDVDAARAALAAARA